MRALFFSLLGLAFSAWGGDSLSTMHPEEYSGMADASAAIAISSNLFWVACDEDNILRLYRSDRGGAPVKEFDCSTFLKWNGASSEADLEGAAQLGRRAFWIGSHGRNKDGKKRPQRCCLFATEILVTDNSAALMPVGRPYRELLTDLINDSRFAQFHFADAAKRAPKAPGALNIEGLSATPGGHLLIGFRSPIPEGHALLIPLVNPNEVIEGKPARFDPAVLLDLDGLGIRDITYHDGSYIIIGGPAGETGGSRLYRWTGQGAKPETLRIEGMQGYAPEAIVCYPETGLRKLQILSDDGNRLVQGTLNKDLTDPGKKKFRSFWIVP